MHNLKGAGHAKSHVNTAADAVWQTVLISNMIFYENVTLENLRLEDVKISQ